MRFKRRLRRDDDFKRILLVVTRQIGDVLLTTPLIREARQRWPGAVIDVLGFAGTLGMLRGNGDVNGLIEVPAGATWRQSLPLILRLWRRYDLALVAQYTDRAHLYAWIAAPVRSGQVPEGAQSRFKASLLAHAVFLGGDHSHVVLEKLKVMAPWVPEPAAPVVVPPAHGELEASLKERIGGRYIVVQVPSLVRYKQWPVRHFRTLVAGLVERGCQVVLSGGPSDTDRTLVRQVAEGHGSAVVDVCGALNLNQVRTLLGAALAYIGPDTSITHLAAACGVPTIAVYGPVDPCIWGPWPVGWAATQPYERRALRQSKGNVILLQGPPTCVPCNRAGCDDHTGSRSECLETLSPARVLAEVDLLLGWRALESSDNSADE